MKTSALDIHLLELFWLVKHNFNQRSGLLTRYLTNKIEIGNLMLPRYRGEPNQILLFILKEQGPPKLMQPMKIYCLLPLSYSCN